MFASCFYFLSFIFFSGVFSYIHFPLTIIVLLCLSPLQNVISLSSFKGLVNEVSALGHASRDPDQYFHVQESDGVASFVSVKSGQDLLTFLGTEQNGKVTMSTGHVPEVRSLFC